MKLLVVISRSPIVGLLSYAPQCDSKAAAGGDGLQEGAGDKAAALK
jgi:hypothetical protein